MYSAAEGEKGTVGNDKSLLSSLPSSFQDPGIHRSIVLGCESGTSGEGGGPSARDAEAPSSALPGARAKKYIDKLHVKSKEIDLSENKVLSSATAFNWSIKFTTRESSVLPESIEDEVDARGNFASGVTFSSFNESSKRLQRILALD